MPDIEESSARRTDVSRGCGSLGISESDSAKVGERDERAVLFKVLDDPLCILLAESVSGSEGLSNGLSGGLVLDDSLARFGGGGGYGGGDDITGTDGDAGEIEGESGEPLIPSWKK